MDSMGPSPSASAASAASSITATLRNGIYGTFYVLSKRLRQDSKLALVGQAFSLLQMLSFCSSPVLEWSNLPSTRWLNWLAGLVFVEGFYRIAAPSVFLFIFYLAVAWSAAFTGLFAWTMRCFMTSSFPVLWPLKVLRAIASLTVSELYIPIVTTLISVFKCKDNVESLWTRMQYDCFAASHLAQAVIAGILLVFMVALCSQFALIFYDSESLSRSLTAKVHGRMDFFFLLLKTTLIVFVQAFPETLGAWGTTVVLLLAAVAWMAAIIYWMPFIHHKTLRLYGALAAVFFACCICTAIAQAYENFDAGIVFFFSAPLAAVAGISLVDYRAKWVYNRPIAGLNNHMEVEMKGRYLIHSWLYGHPTDELHAINLADEDTSDAAMIRASAASAAADRSNSVTHNHNSGKHRESVASRASGTSKFQAHEGISVVVDDFESQLAIARKYISREQLKALEELYRQGLKKFKQSSVLHLFFSRYFASFAQNRHLEMSHLMAAERNGPPLDVGFLIYQARKKSEDVSGSKGQMSALHRVSFEKFHGDARRHVHKALDAQAGLWIELLNPTTDLGKLHDLCVTMNEAEHKAEEAFAQLLLLNPQSLLVLRLYSDFCLRVKKNKEKAALLVADAERIEEVAAKEQAKESGALVRMFMHSSIDVMSDATGIVSISGSGNSLGMITGVNSIACRMLGFARWQLERRNVSCIMPPPFSDWHDLFLKKYLATGEGTVVDYTKCVFALHKSGHMLQVLLCVRESLSADRQPEFVGLMRPLSTRENHIMMTDNFIVTGATLASLQAMDVEASALTSTELHFGDWVPELEVIISELKQAKGTTICIDPLFARRAATIRQAYDTNARDGDVFSQDADQGAGASLATTVEVEEGCAVEPTWARAHLQEIILRSGLVVYVLYWTRLSNDRTTLIQAEARREAALNRLQRRGSSGSMLQSQLAMKKSSDAMFQDHAGTTVANLQAAAPNTTIVASRSPAAHDASLAIGLQSPHKIPPGGNISGCPAMIKTVAFTDVTYIEEDGANAEAGVTVPGVPESADVPEEGAELRTTAIPKLRAVTDVILAATPRVPVGIRSPASPTPVVSTTVKDKEKSDKYADNASGTSSGSSVHTRKLMSNLRRIVSDRQNVLLPSLLWLRRAGIAVTLLAMVLTVVVVVISDIKYAGYTEDMRTATMAAAFMKSALRVGQNVRELLIGTSGLIEVSEGYSLYLFGDLLQHLTIFSGLREELYNTALSNGRGDLYLTVNTVTKKYFVDPVSNELLSIDHRVSLHEACLEFAAEAQAVAALPYLNVTYDNPSVQYILRSTLRGSPIHNALNSSMVQWFRNSIASRAAVSDMWTAVYASMSIILLLLALGVFLPILVFVDKSKDEVVRKFTELPRAVLLKLRADADQNLRRFNESDEGDDDSSGSVVSDDGETETRSQSHDGGSEIDGGSEMNWDAYFQTQKSKKDFGGGSEHDLLLKRPSSDLHVGLPSLLNAPRPKLVALTEVESPVARLQEDGGESLNPGSVLSSDPGLEDVASQSFLDLSSTQPRASPALGNGTPGQSNRGLPMAAASSSLKKQQLSANRLDAGSFMSGKSLMPGGSTVSNYLGPTKRPSNLRQASTNRRKSPRYTKSATPLLVLVIRFISPLIGLFIFFTILYAVAMQALADGRVLSTVSFVSNTRGVLIMDLASQLRAAVRDTGSANSSMISVNHALQTASDLEYTHRLLMFGGVPVAEDIEDAARAGVGDHPLLSDAANAVVATGYFGDVCTLLWNLQPELFTMELYAIFTTASQLLNIGDGTNGTTTIFDMMVERKVLALCRGKLQGVLTHGLHGAMSEYLRLSAFYLNRRLSAQVDSTGYGNMTVTSISGVSVVQPYSIRTELKAPALLAIRDMGFQYLSQMSFVIANQYANAGVARVNNFIMFESVFAAVFLVAFGLFIALYYLPAVLSENRQIRKQRGLLLLLPPQLFRASKEMKALLTTILAGEEDRKNSVKNTLSSI